MRGALAGLAATLLFWILLFVFGALDPQYDQMRQAVSELGVVGAPSALAWNLLGFILPGLLIGLFGASLFPVSRGISVMMVISGIAFAATGVFAGDLDNRQGFSTLAHIVTSQISFVAWLVGLAIALVTARKGRLPGLGWVSFLALLAAVATILARGSDGLPAGLAQKLTFAAYFSWIAAVSLLRLRVLRRPIAV